MRFQSRANDVLSAGLMLATLLLVSGRAPASVYSREVKSQARSTTVLWMDQDEDGRAEATLSIGDKSSLLEIDQEGDGAVDVREVSAGRFWLRQSWPTAKGFAKTEVIERHQSHQTRAVFYLDTRSGRSHLWKTEKRPYRVFSHQGSVQGGSGGGGSDGLICSLRSSQASIERWLNGARTVTREAFLADRSVRELLHPSCQQEPAASNVLTAYWSLMIGPELSESLKSPFICLSKYEKRLPAELKASGLLLRQWERVRSAKEKTFFECGDLKAGTRAQFSEDSGRILLDRDLLQSQTELERSLFHEILHSGGEGNEKLIEHVVDCCAPHPSDANRSCEKMKSLSALDDDFRVYLGHPGLDDLIYLLESKSEDRPESLRTFKTELQAHLSSSRPDCLDMADLQCRSQAVKRLGEIKSWIGTQCNKLLSPNACAPVIEKFQVDDELELCAKENGSSCLLNLLQEVAVEVTRDTGRGVGDEMSQTPISPDFSIPVGGTSPGQPSSEIDLPRRKVQFRETDPTSIATAHAQLESAGVIESMFKAASHAIKSAGVESAYAAEGRTESEHSLPIVWRYPDWSLSIPALTLSEHGLPALNDPRTQGSGRQIDAPLLNDSSVADAAGPSAAGALLISEQPPKPSQAKPVAQTKPGGQSPGAQDSPSGGTMADSGFDGPGVAVDAAEEEWTSAPQKARNTRQYGTRRPASKAPAAASPPPPRSREEILERLRTLGPSALRDPVIEKAMKAHGIQCRDQARGRQTASGKEEERTNKTIMIIDCHRLWKKKRK